MTNNSPAVQNLAKLADNAPAMLYQFMMRPDGSTSFLYVNAWCQRIFGIEPDDLHHSAEPLLGLLHPDDVVSFQASVMESAQTLQPWLWEGRAVLPDGKIMHIRANSMPEALEDGSIVWSGMLTDITDHKQAEEALAQERNLLRTVVNNIPDHIYVKDTASRFVFGNLATAHSLGAASSEAVVGKSDFDFSPAEMAEQFVADDRAFFESGQSPIILEDRIVDRVTDEIRWIQATKALLRDNQEQVIGLVGINRDITEQKRTEEALRQNEASMATAQRIAHVGNWETDIPTNRLAWSDEIYRIFGLTPQEFGATVDAFFARVHPDDLDYVLRNVDDAMNRRKPYNVDHRIVRPNGEVRFAHQEGEVTFDETGQPLRMIGIVQDITAQKQLELQIQELLERRGRQVQIATQISQELAAIVTEQDLHNHMVASLKEQFGFYHAQLFRYNPTEKGLELVAGYGPVGQQMVAQGIRMPLGQGVVGQAAIFGNSILRADLSVDPTWQPQPLLPETAGELVVPIRLGREDAEAQVNALQYFINNNFDGVIVAVINRDLVAPVTQQALRQNIPVVSFTSSLGAGGQTTYFGTSEHEMGYTLGLQAGAWAQKHLPAGQSLKLGILSYRPLPQLIERETGMMAGIKREFAGDLELVASETAGDQVQGLLVAERWLAAYPDLNMILGINDAGALGAYQAVIAAGKDDPEAFFIGGIDAIEEGLAALKGGGAYQATVDISAREAGGEAVRCLVSAIKGQPYSRPTTINPRPVNRTNLEAFLHPESQAIGVNPPAGEADLTALDLSGIKIGMSLITLDNPFFVTLANGARAEAERLGIELALIESKQILGVLAVQSDVAGALDSEDQLALEGIAGQIAVALEKTRLLEEAAIFRQFADTAGQGLSMATLDGKVIYANPTLARMLELESVDDIIDKPIIAHYPADKQQFLLEAVLPAVMQQGQWVGESTLLSVKGNSIPVIENFFLIRDENGQALYLADVITNISEQKQAENELEARLHELNALQRLMSREAWDTFRSAREESSRGYMFDQTAVQPMSPGDMGNGDGLPQLPTRPTSENGYALTRSVAVHGEVIGQIGIFDNPNQPLPPEEQEFLDSIAEEIAAALERARLLEQTQSSLTEAKALYDVSVQFNAATTINDVLQVVIGSGVAAEAATALLLTFDLDESGQPEWAEVVTIWAGQGQATVPVGTRFYLPEFPLARFWLQNSSQPVLIDDVKVDERLDPTTREMMLASNTLAAAIMPLTIAGRWIGLISLSWRSPYHFDAVKERLYNTLTFQMAVVVNNRQLAEETRRRAVQLEKLSQIEAALSQAITEDDIISVLAQALTEADIRVSLQYLTTDEAGQPVTRQPVAIWEHGGLNPADPALGKIYHLADSKLSELWVNNPDELLLISDLNTDPRVDEYVHQMGVDFHFQAMALLPLRNSGRWQGVVSYNWPESHHFTGDETFILRQLMEPVGAIVAGRRAFLTAEESRREAETLYRVSRHISEATNSQEVVMAVAEMKQTSLFNRMTLFLFERDAADNITAMTVTANWHSGQGQPPSPVGRRYAQSEFSTVQLMTSPEPLFFEDVQHDVRLDVAIIDVARQQNIEAMVVLPLRAGGRPLGALLLQSEETHQFAESDVQMYLSLTPQIASAINNFTLLSEIRVALVEVEATQRRYTVQAWETYRSKIERPGYELSRQDVSSADDNLSQLVSEAVAQNKVVAGQVSALLPTRPLSNNTNTEDRPSPDGPPAIPQTGLVAPLAVRGQVIGVLGLQEDKEAGWSSEEIALVQAIAEQMAQAAENIRLLDETQQRAAREQRVGEIGDKIRAAQSLEEALQIAVKEVGLSLQAPRTMVKLEVK